MLFDSIYKQNLIPLSLKWAMICFSKADLNSRKCKWTATVTTTTERRQCQLDEAHHELEEAYLCKWRHFARQIAGHQRPVDECHRLGDKFNILSVDMVKEDYYLFSLVRCWQYSLAIGNSIVKCVPSTQFSCGQECMGTQADKRHCDWTLNYGTIEADKWLPTPDIAPLELWLIVLGIEKTDQEASWIKRIDKLCTVSGHDGKFG